MTTAVCLPLPRNGQYQMQWDYILSSCPPDALYVIGDEEQAPSTNVFSRLSAIYVADASDLPSASQLVVLAPPNGRYIQGNISLEDFAHPTDAIYLFGGDIDFLSETEMNNRQADSLVYVPTESADDLFSWVAYAIVMWDRKSKV